MQPAAAARGRRAIPEATQSAAQDGSGATAPKRYRTPCRDQRQRRGISCRSRSRPRQPRRRNLPAEAAAEEPATSKRTPTEKSAGDQPNKGGSPKNLPQDQTSTRTTAADLPPEHPAEIRPSRGRRETAPRREARADPAKSSTRSPCQSYGQRRGGTTKQSGKADEIRAAGNICRTPCQKRRQPRTADTCRGKSAEDGGGILAK